MLGSLLRFVFKKITNLLRVAGPAYSLESLRNFDASVQSSLQRIVGGTLDENSLLQSSVGVHEGGLGLRLASDLALPAFIASRVELRPLVMSLAETFGLVGLNSSAFIALYDTQVESCTQAFCEGFCRATANQVSDLIDDARVEAIAKFDVLNGRRPHVVHNSPENSLIMPAGGEDPEQETPEHQGLQQRLCAVVDDLRVDELSERMEASHRWGDKRRLHELRDPSVSHDWLWAINPAYGSHVPDEDYVTCVRLRLGAPIIDDAVVCHRCGAAILDRACSHALCCSLGEATKGHNKVRDDILRVVHIADSTAETEVQGLIPDAPSLRPADIFTEAAVPGCQAAMDIGITSPDSTGAGDDCCEAMYRTKMARYEQYLPGLTRRGIRYKPMILSAYGRWHPDSLLTMEAITKRAARKRGYMDHRLLLRRALASIGVLVWRRACAMVRSCLPKPTAEEMALTFGFDPSADIESTILTPIVGLDGPSFLQA